jgi:hypothetical protein
MAQVNLVNKQTQLNLLEIIKFQLITHCYINKITVSELDLDCLTYLGLMGTVELTDFCNQLAELRLKEKLKTWTPSSNSPGRKPDASPQTIRNVLIKAEKEKLILKVGKGRKTVSLNPELKIQSSGNILLNYKFVHIGS